MIVTAASPEHALWFFEQTRYRFGGGWRGIVALTAAGQVRGMVGYDGWTENAVQMHVALPDPRAALALVRPAFSYPFEEIGVKVAYGLTPADNHRGLALASRLGFRQVYRLQDGWADGVDLVLSEMRREECRWLLPKPGGGRMFHVEHVAAPAAGGG